MLIPDNVGDEEVINAEPVIAKAVDDNSSTKKKKKV